MTEHTLISENRETLEVTAVTDVSSFDENTVMILLEEGALSVRGRALKITQLDLDTGRASLSGEIISLTYMKESGGTGSGLLKKLMK